MGAIRDLDMGMEVEMKVKVDMEVEVEVVVVVVVMVVMVVVVVEMEIVDKWLGGIGWGSGITGGHRMSHNCVDYNCFMC